MLQKYLLYIDKMMCSPSLSQIVSQAHTPREKREEAIPSWGSTGAIPPYFCFAPIPTANIHTPPFLYGLGRAGVVQ